MAIKPILFNTEMIRAILDGRKTVTRRAIKSPYYVDDEEASRYSGLAMHKGTAVTHGMPYENAIYSQGDILWVRETWFYERHMEDIQEEKPDLPSGRYSMRYIYCADQPDYPVNVGVYAGRWCPSIHMPKEAARIFLRVTDVRVERLNEVCNIDMESEGISACLPLNLQKKQFGALWDSTIKPADRERYGWDANPLVWVIEFERCEKPEGF